MQREDEVAANGNVEISVNLSHLGHFELLQTTHIMSNLNQEQIKVLEQSRQRLVQLTRSLGSLISSLNQSDPLPPW